MAKQFGEALLHAKFFTAVIQDLMLIHKKWLRGRVGGHPPLAKGRWSIRDVKTFRGRRENLRPVESLATPT
jgi:hypothetical protein